MKTATTASLLSTHTQKKPREPWQEPNCGVVVPAHTPWNYDLNMSYETSNQPTSQKNSLPELWSGGASSYAVELWSEHELWNLKPTNQPEE